MSVVLAFLSEAEHSASLADLTEPGAAEGYSVKLRLVDGSTLTGHASISDGGVLLHPLIWPKGRGRRVERAELSEYPYHIRPESIMWARYLETDDDSWGE